jgi:hypothetical protein
MATPRGSFYLGYRVTFIVQIRPYFQLTFSEHGLLSPERQGQSRIYSQGDRVRLKLILRGKRLGFSLDESKELFELYDPQRGRPLTKGHRIKPLVALNSLILVMCLKSKFRPYGRMIGRFFHGSDIVINPRTRERVNQWRCSQNTVNPEPAFGFSVKAFRAIIKPP